MPHQETKAILWMIANGFWFAVMSTLVRHMSEEINSFIIVFFRNFGALLVLLPWIAIHKKSLWHLHYPIKIHFLRALVGITAMTLWYTSLSLIAMPNAIALSFTAPLFTMLCAIVLLKEKASSAKWWALCIGFTGALVIIRPGLHGFEPESLLVLVTAVFWALANVMVKFLSRNEKAETIVLYMTLFMVPLSTPMALLYWQTPTLLQLCWLLAIGIASNLSFLCLSYAIKSADMSVILPFDFVRLVFAAFFAFLFFNELLDVWTVLGSIIIITSAVYITKHENQRKLKAQMKGMEIV